MLKIVYTGKTNYETPKLPRADINLTGLPICVTHERLSYNEYSDKQIFTSVDLKEVLF